MRRLRLPLRIGQPLLCWAMTTAMVITTQHHTLDEAARGFEQVVSQIVHTLLVGHLPLQEIHELLLMELRNDVDPIITVLE